MDHFHDPAILALDFWTLSRLSHTLDGLYLWEFFTNLDYEWHIIRGHVRYRWSIWVYSLTRIATFIAVVAELVTLNMTNPTHCQFLITLNFTFGFSTFILSSLLIILRVIAVWNWNKGIVALATILWVTNVSLIIHGIVLIRSTWIPVQDVCSAPDLKNVKQTFIFLLITDFILLVTMLIGLLRLRYCGAGTCGLGRLLWKQGLIWLLLATTAELPSVVFVCLDLNAAFDRMFLMTSLITISIAATRMYRSLINFGHSTEIAMDSEPARPPRIDHMDRKFKTTSIAATSLGQVDVAMHTTHQDHPTSLSDNVIYIDTYRPGQSQCDKPDGPSFDDDAKSDV